MQNAPGQPTERKVAIGLGGPAPALTNKKEDMAMIVGDSAEDAAREIAKLIGVGDFNTKIAIAEIIQRAMDDDFDTRMQDAEGS